MPKKITKAEIIKITEKAKRKKRIGLSSEDVKARLKAIKKLEESIKRSKDISTEKWKQVIKI